MLWVMNLAGSNWPFPKGALREHKVEAMFTVEELALKTVWLPAIAIVNSLVLGSEG